MRLLLVAAALAFGLSGCADSAFVEHPITSLVPAWSDDTQPAPGAAPSAPQTAAQSMDMSPQAQTAQATMQAAPMPSKATSSDHCRNLAKLRSRDAAYQGEDESTQESVYNRTYADCTAWDARHGS